MQITKASGLPEDFSEKKLTTSLKNAGVAPNIRKEALHFVKDNLSPDIDTNKVHQLVGQYLKQHSQPLHQLNYNLKRAIFKLGPTGYPFEHFVAQILEQFGYHTKVGVILKGKCVHHEIDIVAKKDNQVFYIECKFHNRPGLKTDIQAALYTYARFQDVISAVKEVDYPKGVQPQQVHHSWLFTNTKATKDVNSYAKCQNMKFTSWGSPGKQSLHDLIITSNLHPITALNSISGDQIKLLLKQNIVTLKRLSRLLKNNQLTNILSKEAIKKVKAEMRTIYVNES
jgi:hypothetical protein